MVFNTLEYHIPRGVAEYGTFGENKKSNLTKVNTVGLNINQYYLKQHVYGTIKKQKLL